VCALRTLQFFYLCRMNSVCCIRCVAYGSLKTNLLVRLHRPTCRFQVVVCNTLNATVARLATQSKNRNMQCTHAIESILFFACIAIFGVFRVHALRVLRCIRQPGNRPLSPFSAALRWQRLCFNIQHVKAYVDR